MNTNMRIAEVVAVLLIFLAVLASTIGVVAIVHEALLTTKGEMDIGTEIHETGWRPEK